MVVNNEFGRLWKEVVVAYIKVLSRHLPAGTAKTMDNLG
jgi:hypothetical protein